MRTYRNPHVLADMAAKQSWPITVTYRDDSDQVEVGCGRWGAEGWIRYRETFAASELPEPTVASRYARDAGGA